MVEFFARIEFIFGYYEYLGQNTPYMFCIAKSEYVDPYSPPLKLGLNEDRNLILALARIAVSHLKSVYHFNFRSLWDKNLPDLSQAPTKTKAPYE